MTRYGRDGHPNENGEQPDQGDNRMTRSSARAPLAERHQGPVHIREAMTGLLADWARPMGVERAVSDPAAAHIAADLRSPAQIAEPSVGAGICVAPHVDGCPECVLNYEAPQVHELITDGCRCSYECADCGHRWVTAYGRR